MTSMVPRKMKIKAELLTKHTSCLQRRYNVAATSRRCSDVVPTLMRRCVFAGYDEVAGEVAGDTWRHHQ